MNQPIEEKIKEFRIDSEFFIVDCLRRYPIIQKGIIQMGPSKTGKTSLFFGGKKKIKSKKGQDGFIYAGVEEDDDAKIGHDLTSKTKVPNLEMIQDKLMLIDSPGFFDTKKFPNILSNTYYILEVLKKIKQIRFLICFPEYYLRQITSLSNTLTSFFHCFKDKTNDQQQKNFMNLIIKSTSFIITKGKGNSEDKMIEKLKKVQTYFEENDPSKKLYNLITQIIVEKNFFIFDEPNEENMVPENAYDFIVKQSSRSFMTINQNSDINYISNQNSPELEAARNNIGQMNQIVLKNLEEMAKIFVEVYQGISTNLCKKPTAKSYEYLGKIRQLLTCLDIYKSRDRLDDRLQIFSIVSDDVKPSMTDFNELIFLKRLEQITTKYSQEQIKQKCFDLCRLIYTFGCQNLQDKQLICHFGYVMHRFFEESQIILRIDGQNRQIPKARMSTHISAITADSKAEEIRFFNSYELRDEFDLQYLNDCQRFLTCEFAYQHSQRQFHRIQNQNNQLANRLATMNTELAQKTQQQKPQFQQTINNVTNQKAQKDTQLQAITQKKNEDQPNYKKIQFCRKKLLGLLYYKKAILLISQNNQDPIEAFHLLQRCRQSLEVLYKQKKQQDANFNEKVQFEVYKNLGQICLRRRKFREAAIFFKAIQLQVDAMFAYRQQTTAALTQKGDAQYLASLKQLTGYLGSISKVEQARKQLQYAFKNAKKQAVRIEINKIKYELLSTQDQKKAQYLNICSQTENYYQIPDPTVLDNIRIE